MSDGPTSVSSFDNSFARELVGMYEPVVASRASNPRALVVNRALAVELGLDPTWLASPAGIDMLVGNAVPAGATPLAQAYSGHQFGGFSPRLGDGRALLVGELIDLSGRRRDLHLKGSGRTPFARGGDGKAAVGPMLREYVVGEAMHALGIPTTRALAVVATGDRVQRDTDLPGAVLARVASSHMRVGTFQFAAAHHGEQMVRRVADFAIARHFPHLAGADAPYLGLLEAVVAAQAQLVAQWMHVGFIHGVMNTDNTTISGETIDYGPCAFMDRFDPATVFSSIDHGGRYAYGNQPAITRWNLARLAETLLPLIDPVTERSVELATAALDAFVHRFDAAWTAGMRSKLGLVVAAAGGDATGDGAADRSLADELLPVLQSQQVDLTLFFRRLSGAVIGSAQPVRALLAEPGALDGWLDRWAATVRVQGRSAESVVAAMDAVNPIYIPRNHMVEAALASASDEGDLALFHRLLDAVTQPYSEREGFDRFAEPAPASFGRHQTFCGT